MTDLEQTVSLTSALEDYLETIFELVRDRKFARIKDIAKARGVRSASVIPAMRRLADLDLITYQKREYIDLTEQGEKAARRVYARHKLLGRFFSDILRMPAKLAQEDACAIEHNISNQGMDHLVRFFEFMQVCPEGRQLLSKFRGCSLIHDQVPECKHQCNAKPNGDESKGRQMKSLKELSPGEAGSVQRITGTGAIRQRLLDIGLMPNVRVELERVSPTGDPIWIRFQGSQVSLRKLEAETVLVIAE